MRRTPGAPGSLRRATGAGDYRPASEQSGSKAELAQAVAGGRRLRGETLVEVDVLAVAVAIASTMFGGDKFAEALLDLGAQLVAGEFA